MSPPASRGETDPVQSDFEQHVRVVLEESLSHVDGRVRSRLNQARHAAAEAAVRKPSLWRRLHLMPAAGAIVAAVLVAFVLWPHSPQGDSILAEAGAGRSTVDDLDLLADGDALDLISDESDGGTFYEWAVDQVELNETSSTGA